MKIMVAFGTRPEAIKMFPIINELKKRKIQTVVCTTGQHKDMLNQVLDKFGIVPDYKLDIMKENQTIAYINSAVLEQMDIIIKQEMPDILLVHGDTTTSLACAQVAFYNKVKVGHIEAGLRTYNKYSPFPEEMNRILISNLSDFHFAPTEINKKNLLNEGIDEKRIFVTGNTITDAVKYTVKTDYEFDNEELKKIKFDNKKKYILVTAHRRENIGKPLENICDAIQKLSQDSDDVEFIFPVHLNPKIKKTVYAKISNDNVKLIEPINVFDMHNLMSKCYLLLTDSGGLQEEGPSLNKPVLVLRNNTERPEAVDAHVAKVIGTKEENIIKEFNNLLQNNDEYSKMKNGINPYGDGDVSGKIVNILQKLI